MGVPVFDAPNSTTVTQRHELCSQETRFYAIIW